MPILRKVKQTDSGVPEVSSQPEEKAPTPPQTFDFDDFLPENEGLTAIAEKQRKDHTILHFTPVGINIKTALDERLVHNICRLYRNLLPLQEYCTEVLLHENKHDLLVRSPTGSGKTAAFCIPAVQIAIQHKSKTGPSVIIICNTQNLAKQTYDQLRCFTGKIPIEVGRSNIPAAKDTGVNIFAMYKGGDPYRSLGNYQPDIVIATMGLLLRNIQEDRLKLTNLQMLMADEADKMIVEGGFFLETQECLRICREKKPIFQVAAFSATYSYFTNSFGSLDLSTKGMKVLYPNGTPVQITVEGAKGYITQRIVRIVKKNLPKETDPIVMLKNTLFVQKLGWLCGILNYDKEQNFRNGRYQKTAVVFVDRITTSNFMTTYLISKGYDVAPLNSSFDLREVNKTLEKLKNGEIQAVIATNKMARGQDVPDLNHVIVFEMSHDFNDYKHRIGRTGRIGKGGMSTTLITEQDRHHYLSLYEFMEEHNQEIPDWLHETYMENRSLF